MATADDRIVTIRDIYALVQQVNTRTSELMHQVNTLASRAEEDRRKAQADREEAERLGEEVGRLKVKVYTATATATAVMSAIVVLSQAGTLLQ